MNYSNTKLDNEALFRLKVLDSYNRMLKEDGRVNVRKFCRVMGISHSWFYKWQSRFNKRNLASLNSVSRKPKNIKTIDWSIVIEICDWKRAHPKKSHYYLYQTWIKEGRVPPCSPKTIYNWWKKRNLIEVRHRRKRRKTKLFNNANY